MPRTPSKTYTEKELEIMRVVWELGEATARQIREQLPGDRHYNSVLTIIRVLERKGHLVHRVEGKAHVYRAKAQPEKSRSRMIGHLIKQVFGGSAAAMVLHLVETGDLTEDDLREVRQQMKERVSAATGRERVSTATGRERVGTATGRERKPKGGKK
ncbi:MAG: BlaI/MecI/CopY family transcriptional regulator [Blastocatellia bacterium]